jgi:hypothetical protein
MWIPRSISLVLFLGNFILPLFLDKGEASAFGRICGAALIGLICVWWGDEMAQYTGFFHFRKVTSPSSPGPVKFMGWVLLSIPYIVIIYQKVL